MEDFSSSLPVLESRIRQDLMLLQIPPENWIKPRATDEGKSIIDVVIIGGGRCGLVSAFALLKLGIRNIRVFDSQQEGREGPWLNYARMDTLRSPKSLVGPALGLAGLTFQAWFLAQWGTGAWNELEKIPTAMWMEYLVWYRRVLCLPVENRREATRIVPAIYGFDVEIDNRTSSEIIAARKVLLATGREGMAEKRIPKALRDFMGPSCQHSSENIDFGAIAGQDVAIIGISASAMDNAAVALESGAHSVTILARAPKVPRINKMKGTVYPGFTHGFSKLTVQDRLSLLSHVFNYRIAPPRNSVQRVWKHPNVKLYLNSEVTDAVWEGGKIKLYMNSQEINVDKVILGTGFKIAVGTPPHLSAFANQIRTFRDSASFSFPNREFLDEFLDFPDLGLAFEFREKYPGKAPFLKNLHEFTFAATVSHGNVSGDIPAVSDGAMKLAQAIAAEFFIQDYPQHLLDLKNYTEVELMGDEIPGNQLWSPDVDDDKAQQ